MDARFDTSPVSIATIESLVSWVMRSRLSCLGFHVESFRVYTLRAVYEVLIGHALASPQLIQIIAPPLGHADAFVPMEAAVIGSSGSIALAVGKGTFDRIRAP